MTRQITFFALVVAIHLVTHSAAFAQKSDDAKTTQSVAEQIQEAKRHLKSIELNAPADLKERLRAANEQMYSDLERMRDMLARQAGNRSPARSGRQDLSAPKFEADGGQQGERADSARTQVRRPEYRDTPFDAGSNLEVERTRKDYHALRDAVSAIRQTIAGIQHCVAGLEQRLADLEAMLSPSGRQHTRSWDAKQDR